jgi:hypothetical protein
MMKMMKIIETVRWTATYGCPIVTPPGVLHDEVSDGSL